MERVQPGERVACGVRVPPCVRAESVRQQVVRVQARSGPPVLLELDEHRSLQHASEAREVGMKRRGHHRLAVSERERGELPKNDVVRDAERVDGADRADPRDDRAAALPEPSQHIVHRTRERHLRGIDRMGATALAGRIVHPHVVDVGDQDRESHDELLAVKGPRGEETAVDDVGELERAGRHVTSVNDPVIAEERRMGVGRAENRPVAGKRLHGRLLLDGVPEPLLQDRPDVLGEVAIHRAGSDAAHRASLRRRRASVGYVSRP